jgi:hypothetical protein
MKRAERNRFQNEKIECARKKFTSSLIVVS